MTKLWSVKVNNWGWDSPMVFYAKSRKEAEEIEKRYPASDGVQYAGNFTDSKAKQLLLEDMA